MEHRYPRIFLFPVLFFLLAGFSARAQLSNFSFSVTHTEETCTANACVTFTVSNTTPGASMLYSIYKLPDTTVPITVTSAGEFCGLDAGNYQVIAAQSLGSQTGTQQQSFTVLDEIENLSYNLASSTDLCGTVGTLTVNVISGNPVSYEIMSGPEVFPAQSSNVFTGLSGGVYQVRVFDGCGEGVVQTINFSLGAGSSLSFATYATSEVVSCNVIAVTQIIETQGNFAYPLVVTYTVYPPSGPPQTVTSTIVSGDPTSLTLTQDLVLYPDEFYSYDVSISDACGHSYAETGNIINETTEPFISPADVDCQDTSYILYDAVSGTVVSAPDAYAFELPHLLETDAMNQSYIPNLPAGVYVVSAIDICGEEHLITFTVEPIPVTDPIVAIQKGCEEGFGSIYLKAFQGIATIEMISAPAAYPDPLPQDLVSFLDTSLALRMAGLPEGNYVFHLTNSCGNEWTWPVTIDPFTVSSSFDIVEHCGSFDLNLQYEDNSTSSIFLGLQKFFPASNAWGNPATGVLWVPGTAITLSNALSINNGANNSLLFTGQFRIVSYRSMFSNFNVQRHCVRELGTFEFLGIPIIHDAYSFSCDNASFDVIIDASGSDPLQYRITTFNSSPFPLDNGTSNLFTGLAPGIYNFQVEDSCGNIANRLFEISEPYPITIVGTGNCEGQPVSISVPYYPFLQYSWYNDSNPGVVLSTTGSLEFPVFSAADVGTYSVHIATDNPESCVNETLSYTIADIVPLPQSGLDSNVDWCGNQGQFDLNTTLSGNYQPGGDWNEITSSGMLDGAIWDSAAVAAGTYSFSYTVSGECGPDSVSLHSVTIHETPENPVAFLGQDLCGQADLQLLATQVDGAVYSWTGPDGFTSSEQNPLIVNATAANNGIYTVQAFIGECASGTSSVEVSLGTMPEFTISASCDNQRMMMAATPASADGNSYSYDWTGPGGFAATGNPVDITGNASGAYLLTVTNQAGCTAGFEQQIAATLCQIQQGISVNGDGVNDVWDLSGFGNNLRVKIFNRYGMVVYELDDYAKEWHGQDKNGHDLPSATYYYYISSAAGDEKTGWVYLLRY